MSQTWLTSVVSLALRETQSKKDLIWQNQQNSYVFAYSTSDWKYNLEVNSSLSYGETREQSQTLLFVLVIHI